MPEPSNRELVDKEEGFSGRENARDYEADHRFLEFHGAMKAVGCGW